MVSSGAPLLASRAPPCQRACQSRSRKLRDLVASFRDLGPRLFLLLVICSWSRGVTVSTLDSESSDRGSDPRGTSMPTQLLCTQVTCLSACAQEVNAIPACTFASKVHKCWSNLSVADGHISPNASDLFRPPKLSGEEPA